MFLTIFFDASDDGSVHAALIECDEAPDIPAPKNVRGRIVGNAHA